MYDDSRRNSERATSRRRSAPAGAWMVPAALVALVTAGCGTPRIDETGMPTSPLIGTHQRTALADAQAIRADLGVDVTARAKERPGRPVGESQALADRIRKRVLDHLMRSGFKPARGDGELSINLEVAVDEVDRTGSMYVYDAEADASLGRAFDMSTVRTRNFMIEGEATRGKVKALARVAEPMADQVTDWIVAQGIDSLAGVEAIQVNIAYPRFFGGDPKSYPDLFVRTVRSELRSRGVLDCRVVAHSPVSRQSRFRIVYYPENFPAGILTELVNLPGLKLKPVQ